MSEIHTCLTFRQLKQQEKNLAKYVLGMHPPKTVL